MAKGKHLFWLCLILLSCEKEEPPYPPARGGLLTAAIGKDYSRSSYLRISDGTFAASRERDVFQLSFSSASPDSAIFLNSFNFMFARKSGDTNYSAVLDTNSPHPWTYDFPDGDPGRTALRGARNAGGALSKEVFILDLGYDKQFNKLGYWKFQLLGVDEESYTFRIGPLDSLEGQVQRVERRLDHRRVMWDAENAAEVLFEPAVGEWDLCFTQYTDYDLTEQGDTLVYLVRGVLSDRGRLTIARADSLDWASIQLSDAVQFNYTEDAHAIGYDWKTYDFNTATYVTDTQRVFLLNSPSGFYKMRFLDYYNDAGERGFPSFELQGL